MSAGQNDLWRLSEEETGVVSNQRLMRARDHLGGGVVPVSPIESNRVTLSLLSSLAGEISPLHSNPPVSPLTCLTPVSHSWD